MADFANGNIEAYCGSQELGAKDNLEAVICAFIKHARKTLDIAVQEIDNEFLLNVSFKESLIKLA